MTRKRMVLLGSADVGRRLGVSPDRVRALAREGRIVPLAVTPRGERLFSEETIVQFERERQERKSA